MTHKFMVERYAGEQAVIERDGTTIVSVHFCGDLTKLEAAGAASAMAYEYHQEQLYREESEIVRFGG